jgi:hypothetical protein
VLASAAVAFLILLTFPETGSSDGDDDSFDLTAAFKAVRSQLMGSALIPFVLYAGIFYAVIAGLNYLVQPVAKASGISIAQIGLLYAGFRALSAGVFGVILFVVAGAALLLGNLFGDGVLRSGDDILETAEVADD